jgi:hypothetical protein
MSFRILTRYRRKCSCCWRRTPRLAIGGTPPPKRESFFWSATQNSQSISTNRAYTTNQEVKRLFIQRASPALLGAQNLLFSQIELAHYDVA